MAVTLRIEGLDKVLKGMKNYTEQKKKAVDQIFKDGADQIRNKALRRVPVDEGQLKNAIHVNRIPEGYEVVVQNQYAVFVETGTKSHFQVDSEFQNYVSQFRGQQVNSGNFYQNILEYVRRHKIRFEARSSEVGAKRQVRKRYLTDEQVAFMIMRSIQREGIKAQPYLLNSFVEVRAEMVKLITQELRG